MKKPGEIAIALIAGFVFGIGLIYSGMIHPEKVQGFLDITGLWDPSLGLVMGGAIMVALPVFQLSWRTSTGISQERRQLDRPLIVGSLLFGIGWGLSGYCPGPALVAASSGSWEALWYVIAMAVGIVFAEQVSGAQDEEVTLLSSIANDR